MSHYTRRAFVPAAALTALFLVGGIAPIAHAAAPSVQAESAQEQSPARPMVKKEPMTGEMKKDGMLKEDVSKAEKQWSKKMDESMKQEKMK